ncbi:MAG: hypothetical protein ACXW25_10725 [Rhodospirillales bacterium]
MKVQLLSPAFARRKDVTIMDAASPEGGLTLATWFWLLVPMLTCVALSIVTYAAAAARRRRARPASS